MSKDTNNDPSFRGRLIVFIIIGITGLVTAYVCFGLLKSSADGKYKDYSVGGAIAGALFSWMVLLYMYSRLRKPDDDAEIKTLRKKNEELQQKLLRGAPSPVEFKIEVAEDKKIVLARSEKWEPKGGLLFDFEEPEKQKKDGEKEDDFLTRFTVNYIPIKDLKKEADTFYKDMIASFENNDYTEGYNAEFITIGGDPSGIKSLKIVSKEFFATGETKDLVSDKPQKVRWSISKTQYEEAINQDKKEETKPAGDPVHSASLPPVIKVLRMVVVCYNADLKNVYYFNFWDNSDDFTKASAEFNKIISSVRFLN